MSTIVTSLLAYLALKLALPGWITSVLNRLVVQFFGKIPAAKMEEFEDQVKHAILAFILRGTPVPTDENGLPLDRPKTKPWYQYGGEYDTTKPGGGVGEGAGTGKVLDGEPYDPTKP